MNIPAIYVGEWRITHMDGWDQDVVDLEVPGHFTIRKNGIGTFQFGGAQGEMDCCVDQIADATHLAFSWEGSDDCDRVSGRGWVNVKGKRMRGHIFYHLGPDSAFKAEKTKRTANKGLQTIAGVGSVLKSGSTPREA